ncbi:MAG TPA: hypothetical protein VFF06_01095, partial [Polyangia bacterium]|nr:hypothetical protein [Polyangia bacterium]
GDAGPPRGCGACFVACEEIVTGQLDPGYFLLAADDTGLVWSSGVEPVHFFSQAAGAAKPVLLASDTLVEAAQADATSIYWMSGVSAGGAVAFDRIFAIARAGGSATPLGMTVKPNSPGVLALDDANLYFTDVSGPTRALERLAKSGGAITPLASGFQPTAATALADGSALFFADFSNDVTRLWRLPLPGTTATPLATIGFTRVLRADGDHLYWSDGALETVPQSGGAPLALQPNVRGPFAIANGQAYWIDTDCTPGSAATCLELHGDVLTAPLTVDASPRALCSGRLAPWNLAVAGKYLYVADQASGQILRLTP